ncbi:protease inhibitor Inh/omp19 family protein [Azorhizobium doebereinerae]|uniref:protease inhibitor Inh/omp19 family protein n=1 Tax=Azorhizobium doebereinerae TaxID=281091 RepID=UPI000401BCCB|nr:protease inhibitor Inh/omp19 family protein [Azorhizobium doebereinerae]
MATAPPRGPGRAWMAAGLALALVLAFGTAPRAQGTGGNKPPAALPGKPAAKPAAPSATPAPKGPDPALRAEAEKRAGTLTLASADGERTCSLQLKTVPAPPGFALAFAAGGCPAIAFAAQVAAWMPDPSGAIRLLSAQGRTVAEFTEGAGGAYEALREGDGVYFLAPPSALQDDMVRPEEMLGEWDLARAAGSPLCRWTFSETPAPAGGFAIAVGPGCDAGLAAFQPVAWRLEGGNVLVSSGGGGGTLRFARQEDGGWAKVPERGRPLLMSRP